MLHHAYENMYIMQTLKRMYVILDSELMVLVWNTGHKYMLIKFDIQIFVKLFSFHTKYLQ